MDHALTLNNRQPILMKLWNVHHIDSLSLYFTQILFEYDCKKNAYQYVAYYK